MEGIGVEKKRRWQDSSAIANLISPLHGPRGRDKMTICRMDVAYYWKRGSALYQPAFGGDVLVSCSSWEAPLFQGIE